MSDLLDDVPALPEEEPVFQSSGTAFEIKSNDGHPVLRMIGIFVLALCYDEPIFLIRPSKGKLTIGIQILGQTSYMISPTNRKQLEFGSSN